MNIRLLDATEWRYLVALHRDIFGSSVNESWFRWKHLDNPAGPSALLIAEKNDSVYAAYGFWKNRLRYKGRDWLAAQAVDVMVHPRFERHLGRARTILKIYRIANDTVASGGCSFMFGFPNVEFYPLVMKGFKAYPSAHVPLYAKILDAAHFGTKLGKPGKFLAPVLSLGRGAYRRWSRPRFDETDDVSVRVWDRFDDRATKLFNQFVDPEKIVMIRDKTYLNWRYIDAPLNSYRVWAAFREEELCGWMAATFPEDRSAAVILDWFIDRNVDCFNRLLYAVEEHAVDLRIPVMRVWTMPNQIGYSDLRAAKYVERPSTFRLTVRSFDESLPLEDLVTPERWRIVAGDSDGF